MNSIFLDPRVTERLGKLQKLFNDTLGRMEVSMVNPGMISDQLHPQWIIQEFMRMRTLQAQLDIRLTLMGSIVAAIEVPDYEEIEIAGRACTHLDEKIKFLTEVAEKQKAPKIVTPGGRLNGN